MYKILICAILVLVSAEDVAKKTEEVTNVADRVPDKVAAESNDEPVVFNEPMVYDAFFGKPVTTRRQNFLANVVNGSVLCTVVVQPCRENEGRRVDGTCSNPKYPSRGATLTPFPRLLPPRFGSGNTLRPAKDGSELPSTRVLRTTLLGDGFFVDHDFSLLATHVLVFSFIDNVELFYILRYGVVSDCCINNQVPNPAGPFCIPIRVPADDPYLRRSSVRCMNLTRVETYQDNGCLPRTLPAERYNRVPPLLDLSVIYGNTDERSKEIRADQSGLLAFKMEGDREVPAGNAIICINNRPPETSCYNFGDPFQANLVAGTYMTAMWFFREHNRLARKLATMNPCWDDEKLFQTAREINIAQWQYIFYYELIAELLGRKNALAEGLIYDTYDYVNDFDPKYEPGVFREYVIASRWFHTFQPTLFDLYRNGKYYGSRSTVDDNLRSGILALNNTEADLTEGCLIQPAAGFDKIMEPDLAERAYGELQTASDLPAIDMMRGRDAGLPPYNAYRKFCGMKVAKKFEDFQDTINKDKVEMFRRLYDDVDDVDLMTAIYVERLLPGAYVGPTLYCIMVNNLLLWRKSDKFFFEHGDFPAALTLEQLYEVKQTSMARILCDNGDGVDMIQPQAMLKKGPWNDFVSCKAIPGIDLSKWEDRKCSSDKHQSYLSSFP